jgi:hypothetical protein
MAAHGAGIEGIELGEGLDKVSRSVDPSGQYTISSMYAKLLQGETFLISNIYG